MLCVVSLSARRVYLPCTFGSFYYPRSLSAIAWSVILWKSVLIVLNTWNLRCCLVAIKEAVLFFSCLFLLVFHCEWGCGCGCGCLMPFMPLWRCLRPAILVDFPRSHSFPLFYVRNYLFGHLLGSFLAIYWSCKVAQDGGPAHQLCRSSSLALSGHIASSFSHISVFRHPSSFISREPTNSLAQWEFISERVLPHEEPMCLVWE